MSNLASMTSQAIEELESSPEIANLRIVLEEHFDVWTQRLFPLLLARKIGCYRYVTAMLHMDGHTKATEELVATYMRRIREKRKLDSIVRSKHDLKGPRGVTPTVTLTRPAREFRADPGVRVQATDRPVAQAVSSHPVAVPSVKPVEVTDWRSELIRLEREKSSDPWTGADQWMWNYFEAVARSMGRTLPRDFMSVEKSVGDPIKIDCLDKLLAKRM